MAAKRWTLKLFLFYVVAVSLPVAVGFLVLEFGLARFYYSNVLEISDKAFDPVLGWTNREGTYWVKPPHGFRKHSVVVNAHGLRHRELADSAGAAGRRILVLGDSFTYGKVTPHEELFTTLLEERLQERLSGVEVVNAGAAGYGNAQQLLLMKKLGDARITADVYLVVLFTNDILDNLRLSYGSMTERAMQPGLVLGADGTLELAHRPPRSAVANRDENFVAPDSTPARMKTTEVFARRLESFLQTEPALLELAESVGISVDFPRMPGLINGWYREETFRDGVPLMKAIIAEMQRSAKRYDAQLLVTLIPSPIQVYAEAYGPMLQRTFSSSEPVKEWLEDGQRPQRTVTSICEELEIPFLDLYPILRETNERELYIPREGHFTREGHAVTAGSLAEFVIANVE